MWRNEIFQASGCNCPQMDTVKIALRDGRLCGEVSLPEDIKGKVEITQTAEGINIKVKQNADIAMPLQVLDLMGGAGELSAETSGKIELLSGARLRLLHCDDSASSAPFNLINRLEVEIGENASLDYYKLENVNETSSVETSVNFRLNAFSRLRTFGLSLNGQRIANRINVDFIQSGAEADLNGLYLMDASQHSSTEVNVRHLFPECTSNQLFKGIADDSARADFLGHIYVDYGAHGTSAQQNSKNMQLTDKAKVNARPFLEIYNDDVKCSHGATVGQLDSEALFYLKTRGISDRSAKMLLMYAFCEEVLSKSDITELKEGLADLIKRRLQGELTGCGECVFRCSMAKEDEER